MIGLRSIAARITARRMSDRDQPAPRPPRMPLDDLVRAAEIIYGPEWQTPLAADLKVALRTVQRWASGNMQPPDVRGDLAAICRRRAAELTALADRLDGAAP